MSADPKDVALAFFEAFWAADMDAVRARLAPGARFLMMPSIAEQRDNDAAEALQRIIDTMFVGFDPAHGLRCEITSIVAERDEVAMEYTARALTRHGKPYQNYYSAHLKIRDDLVQQLRTYADTRYLTELLMTPEAG